MWWIRPRRRREDDGVGIVGMPTDLASMKDTRGEMLAGALSNRVTKSTNFRASGRSLLSYEPLRECLGLPYLARQIGRIVAHRMWMGQSESGIFFLDFGDLVFIRTKV